MDKTCRNCGRVVPRITRGLCSACYGYERRHGVPRPARGNERLKRGPQAQYTSCKQCGKDQVQARGLCAACYYYEKRHGRPRPPQFYGRSWQKKVGNCGVCSAEAVLTQGRCSPCYQYWRRHGRDRLDDLQAAQPRTRGCLQCGREKIIIAHGLCWCCYKKEWLRRRSHQSLTSQ